MPGAVPFTSTMALTNVTLMYILKIANLGWENACKNDESLSKGLNIVKGKIVYKELEGIFD
jgi:alanine dehydrogenase